MTDGPLVARATLRRTEDGYEGPIAVWSYLYTARIRKNGDAVELDLFDTAEPAESYKFPLLDDDK